MAISQAFLDELTARLDIVDLVSGYVQLTRKGANYFGLCPFHNEKTGSFSVNAEKQIYHCFGCGAGGGPINFIMQIEGLTFPDAVEFLARRAGMEVVREDGGRDQSRHRRERILELNRMAARFYYTRFLAQEGEGAREYAARRGLQPATIKRFGIGYAPDQWDSLIAELTAKGVSKEELLEAGLVVKNKKGGVYDRFRNRLMFPIINIRDEIVAFGGRILDDGEPKYLNSPDTLAFNKSRNLFAINVARKTRTGRMILTEGNMDAISLQQAGFDNAIASCGTSLTEEQARLLTRYCKEVVIAYDSDEAGRKAVLRAIGILERTGLQVKVLNYTGAKDPDEYIKKNGADAFRLLIDGSSNHIAYRMELILRKYDLEDPAQKVQYLREAAELLSTLKPIEREIYGRQAAELAGVSPQSVEQAAKDAFVARRKREAKKELRKETSPVQAFQPRERDLRYSDPVSARAEEDLLALLASDDTLAEKARAQLSPEEFSSDFLGKVYGEFLRQVSQGQPISPAALETRLSPEEMARVAVFLARGEGKPAGERELSQYIGIIRRQRNLKSAVQNDDALLRLAESKRNLDRHRASQGEPEKRR